MPETLVVAGGCRHVGTSFVAGIAALAACRQKLNVLLIDGVTQDGTQHTLFGAQPRANLWDLADHRAHPAEIAIAVDTQLTLMPGASRTTTPCPANDAVRRAVLHRVAEAYGHVDLIIVDAGSMLDAVRAATETLDAELLLVTAGERITLASSHAMAKALRMTHPQRRISVAANRDPRGAESCALLSGAAARFLGSPLLVAGSVPDDRSVHAALHAGFNLIDAAENSIATIAVTGVLAARTTSRDLTAVSAKTTASFLALSRSRS